MTTRFEEVRDRAEATPVAGKVVTVSRKIMGPIIKPLHDEQASIREVNNNLSPDTVILAAIASLWAVISDALEVFMLFSFYSTLDSADFVTYHAFTPWFKISGALAFMFAVHTKGITYWLVYAIPALLIIGQIVLLGLINGWLQPEQLEAFDFGPTWWRSQAE